MSVPYSNRIFRPSYPVSRDDHSQKPQGDQSNKPDSLLDSEELAGNPRKDPYVAPLPPSSPLSPSQDPLAKVTDYIDNVLRPRGGECTDVEAIGLSMLIQSSVNCTCFPVSQV